MIKNRLSQNNMLNGTGFYSQKGYKHPIRLKNQTYEPVSLVKPIANINPNSFNLANYNTKESRRNSYIDSFKNLSRKGTTGAQLREIAKGRVDGFSSNGNYRWNNFLSKPKKGRGCGCGGFK
tara:strand:- start:1417 stop:1782 length:366 start_codon:yes stop_codon:yes gene_type:complete